MNAIPLPSNLLLLAAGVGALSAGVFGCVDTALTAVSSARLDALTQSATSHRAKGLRRLTAARERIHARYLTGRIAGLLVASGSYAVWLAGFYDRPLTLLGLMAAALLLIGGMMHAAASIGQRSTDWVITSGLIMLRPFELLLAPLSAVMRPVRLLVPEPQPTAPSVTEAEVEILIDQSEREGGLAREPAELLRNVLEFADLTARTAMVPRTQIIAIKLGTPLHEVVRTITKTGHSRYPVYRQEIDDVFGVLHSKDLFQLLKASWRPVPGASSATGNNGSRGGDPAREAHLSPIVRAPVRIVSESQPLSKLLREMRQDRQHMAMVVDEFGDMAGLVTLEDILEEIVGDIQDEHDVDSATIVQLSPGRLLADATITLGTLSEYLGSELDPDDSHYESLGGMLTDKVGGIPKEGTRIPCHGLDFVVRESDAKHISKVEIIVPSANTTGPQNTA